MKKSKPSRKIIVYGGSFDPPHNEHVNALKAAVLWLKPEKTLIVPAWKSPFKKSHWAGFGDRVKMMRLALKSAGLAGRETMISGFEYRAKKTVYTYRTMDYFAAREKNAKIYFLMGSDCYESFHKWKRNSRILVKCALLVARRRNFAARGGKKYPAVFLKGFFPDVSSASIRKEIILRGKTGKVPSAVMRYIREKNLYLSGARRWLKKNLSPARFRHSLRTARLAAEMAERLGADAADASAAGLLHDAARDFPVKKLIKICAGMKIRRRREIIENAPVLLHSFASGRIAEKKFGVKDSGILKAIRLHPAGGKKVSLLAKIVFVADLAEPGRKFGYLRAARVKTGSELNDACEKLRKAKRNYVAKSGKWVYPENE